MRRTVIAELLDSDDGTPEDIALSVADLRRINRLFGGISTTRDMLSRVTKSSHVASRREISLLDIAAASGDVTLAASASLARKGIRLTRTLLDRSVAHLPSNGNAARILGDALRLPFADESFDLVTCSLFVHHLEPEQIVEYSKEALRVSRTAVLINDLRRNTAALALTYLGFPLFRSHITRHDAVASVRRAYTIPELKAILRQLPVRRIEFHPHYLFRMGVIIWKR